MPKPLTTLLFLLIFLCIPVLTLAVELPNPLDTNDPRVLAGRIIQGVLGISGALALLFFIYGGVLYLVSQGERDRIERGKQTIIWATLGLVVIFGSYIFLRYMFQALIGAST